MTWVRLDDTFGEDPRWEDAGPLAMALYVAMLCFCSRNGTDGKISARRARRLLDLDEPDDVLADLVLAEYLHPVAEGFELVDYLENQPSAEDVARQRALKKERQQRWVDARRDASPRTSQDASRDASKDGAPRDGAPPRPAPPRRKAGAGRGAVAASSASATEADADPAPWSPQLVVTDRRHREE